MVSLRHSGILLILSNLVNLLIPWERGGSDFNSFWKNVVRCRAPSRIKTNPQTRVDLIRPNKNLEFEFGPDFCKKHEIVVNPFHPPPQINNSQTKNTF